MTISISSMEWDPTVCYICPKKLNLPPELSFRMSHAWEISDPSNPFLCTGLLIIKAPYIDDKYHFAVIEGIVNSGFIYFIHDCQTHTMDMFGNGDLRILRLIPQIIYQPHPPYEYMARWFQAFLEHERTGTRNPFLSARIIPNLSKICVIGDLHGNSKALRRILCQLYVRKIMSKTGLLIPHNYMIFTGDLTDRGPNGPEVWTWAMQLRYKNQQQVFVLRGNHETIDQAISGNFFEQMQRVTCFSTEGVQVLLNQLFDTLPFGLIIGRAPEPRHEPYNNPYRFLFFCHGGIDPVVDLKYRFQKIIQDHKKSGKMGPTSWHFSHACPEASGLLWTDFRADRYPYEPANRSESVRGADVSLFNVAAMQEFFTEHSSMHPRHPYVLDGVIRGHQHIDGIGKLAEEASSEEDDWQILSDGVTDSIKPGSIYTITSATKWITNCTANIESHAEITFDEDSSRWHIKPHSVSIALKKPELH